MLLLIEASQSRYSKDAFIKKEMKKEIGFST